MDNSPTSQTCERMSVSWILSFGLILKQDLRKEWLDVMASTELQSPHLIRFWQSGETLFLNVISALQISSSFSKGMSPQTMS